MSLDEIAQRYTVRESRNEVHFEAFPPLPNSADKAAALLIGAVTHLRILYRVRDGAGRMLGRRLVRQPRSSEENCAVL